MQSPPENKLVLLVFLAFLLAGSAHSEFYIKSLSVFMNANQDGSVNVEERLALMMNGTSSELYEETRAAYSDLASWKERTALSEVRYHISRANAEIANVRVIPQAIERCNPYMQLCHATLVIDYTVLAESKNGSGVFRVDRYKPRTAKYSLQQSALSFEQTRTGDLILPPNTNISIAIPVAAEKIYFSASPANIAGEEGSFRYDQTANVRYYTGSARLFNWQGDTLSKFQFTYEVEFPLETEVMEFFRESQSSIILLFLGPQGIAALILIAAGAATAYYFNRLNK